MTLCLKHLVDTMIESPSTDHLSINMHSVCPILSTDKRLIEFTNEHSFAAAIKHQINHFFSFLCVANLILSHLDEAGHSSETYLSLELVSPSWILGRADPFIRALVL